MIEITNEREFQEISRDVKRRLSRAETERNRFASSYNDFYDMAAPHRKRVGKRSNVARAPDEQNEIFDTTLQDAADDFQSDMIDLFTPRYRDWTNFQPSEQLGNLGTAQSRQIDAQIKALGRQVFAQIRESNFYEAIQEAWGDIGVGCGAIEIPNAGVNETVRCELVQAADLLLEAGPNGIDGRWREKDVSPALLEIEFPSVDFTRWRRKYPSMSKDNVRLRSVRVTHGFHRVWENRDAVEWLYTVFVGGDMTFAQRVFGLGAPTILPFRWRVASPSPWGVGPFPKALPPARTLNELHYLMLKWLGKQVDPPFLYDQDTIVNFKGGIDAGRAYPRMPGTQIEFLLGQHDIRGALFEQEDLRFSIRRALFQDKPFQRGDTPPTATQWLDEKAFNNRRLELPRERINRELVMGVIQRFMHIDAERGLAPQIEFDGKTIRVEPISPLSKASDAEEVSIATQVLQIAQGFFPEQVGALVDGAATLERIKTKLDDELVAIRSPEDVEAILTAQQASGESPAGGQAAA